MNTHAERQPRFRCDVCQQGFTRTDHLKRHQLRRACSRLCIILSRVPEHIGSLFCRYWCQTLHLCFLQRLLCAMVCSSQRGPWRDILLTQHLYSDSLRNHYADCARRGDRPIPETDQKGRRRHACELVRCHFDPPKSSSTDLPHQVYIDEAPVRRNQPVHFLSETRCTLLATQQVSIQGQLEQIIHG